MEQQTSSCFLMRIFKKKIWRFLTVFTALGMIIFSGCSLSPVVDSTRFYVLDVENYRPVSAETEKKGIVLGINRVQLPRYLDSPEIVIRERENRIVYSKNNRWAEPLEYGVARVLAEILRQEPIIADVTAFPTRRRSMPDFDLHVSVLRAEGSVGNDGFHGKFHAIWELRADENQLVASGEIEQDSLPWDGENIEQLAAVLGGAIAELSQQIVLEIEKL